MSLKLSKRRNNKLISPVNRTADPDYAQFSKVQRKKPIQVHSVKEDSNDYQTKQDFYDQRGYEVSKKSQPLLEPKERQHMQIKE